MLGCEHRLEGSPPCFRRGAPEYRPASPRPSEREGCGGADDGQWIGRRPQKEQRGFRMTTNTEATATLEDLYRVEGKAELIGGRIVHLMASGDIPSQVAFEIAISL